MAPVGNPDPLETQTLVDVDECCPSPRERVDETQTLVMN
jgi:hypothetical protein